MAQKVKLISAEGAALEVEPAVLEGSRMLSEILGDSPDEESIPLPTVSLPVLEKVVEFLRYTREHPFNEKLPRPLPSKDLSEVMPKWFVEFITSPPKEFVLDLLVAANFMSVQPLVELASARIGADMKDLSIQELR